MTPGDEPVPVSRPGQTLRTLETGTRLVLMGKLDRVLATVLFTDIVDSTPLVASLGDRRWREVLEAHQSRTRSLLGRFRGREVDTAGDGFLSTFDGPIRAVRCALAATEAVRDLGVEIRAGLETGEVELSGGSVRGIAVHIGARIAALAGPSEVLTSSTVKDLVAGAALQFADLETHELKGVPGAWHEYRVLPWAGGLERPSSEERLCERRRDE